MPRHLFGAVSHLSLLLYNLNKDTERQAGISIVQWSILNHLIDMPAASAQELADAVKLHPSTLTQTIKRLVRKKLIFVTEDPRDSRKKIISLTRNGKTTLDRADEKMEKLARNLHAIQTELYAVEKGLSSLRNKKTSRSQVLSPTNLGQESLGEGTK